MATVPDGGKTYLNDERKSLADRNKTAWERLTKPDGSAAVALVEWNCADKSRRARQMTFYDADQSVIGTKKKGFVWLQVIPGSVADFLYHRICPPVLSLKWAQITSDGTALRAFSDRDAPVTRSARRGEKFQIVPESGSGGWFNIVDAKTQEDYWLRGDSFITVTAVSVSQKATAAKGELAKQLSKKRKSIKRARKN